MLSLLEDVPRIFVMNEIHASVFTPGTEGLSWDPLCSVRVEEKGYLGCLSQLNMPAGTQYPGILAIRHIELRLDCRVEDELRKRRELSNPGSWAHRSKFGP
ncbi:uncharacterized protein H6S33_006290 [Morchella sextelata]|uniref:uncharacterized protein n=1 Tax=Morchella sextelata TaxID=1174677 RepID=UPI001D036C32|nr:uncharacterized protein H6S33_006290 [Morchella sextelata]KAH0604622.1 hypothetical protein H6S33_006290 [Morchella sextelata]